MIFAYGSTVDFLIVTLGANNAYEYVEDHNSLYNYFKDNYSYRYILTKDKLLTSIPIKNGKLKELNIYSDIDIIKYLSNDINLDDIIYEYSGTLLITKKVKINDKLGTISIKYNNEVLDTYDVYLKEEIEYKLNIFIKIFIISVPIILFIIIIKKKKRKNKYRNKKIRN